MKTESSRLAKLAEHGTKGDHLPDMGGNGDLPSVCPFVLKDSIGNAVSVCGGHLDHVREGLQCRSCGHVVAA